MSIEYDHYDHSTGEMTLECDECDNVEAYEGDDWHEALAAATADGWRTFKDSRGDWIVKCPDCVGYGTPPEAWDDD